MKTRKRTCYVFVFDGFADWEIAYATVGIRKSEQYELKTIAFSKEPVTSMGGLTVTPDIDFVPEVDLADIDPDNTALLILPGGYAWEKRLNEALVPLVAHCMLNGIPVAAICGATLFLADLGILNRTPHTSNSLAYLEVVSSGYRGMRYYQVDPAVRTESIITANGGASLEFASEIFETLSIAENEEVEQWFQYLRPALVEQ